MSKISILTALEVDNGTGDRYTCFYLTHTSYSDHDDYVVTLQTIREMCSEIYMNFNNEAPLYTYVAVVFDGHITVNTFNGGSVFVTSEES